VLAAVIEAVVALVVGSLAKAIEVLADRSIRGIVFTGYGMHFRGAQTREQLLRAIKFGRLRQMRDVAGMNGERRLLRHTVD
jgi:hypothetical protein